MKRTTRRKVNHVSLYAILAVVVVVLALTVDWPRVRDSFLQIETFDEAIGDLVLIGVKNTVIYTALAFTGGLVLAIVLALMKMSPVGIYRWLATAYIEFFRGLPALIVILMMAFGMPLAFSNWDPPGGTMGSGLIGLVLVAGAYMAETLRAGIQAVAKGQTEAARSLGMSGGWTMTSVVMPQAVRVVIPPLTNELVLLIKDTSLLFVIGLAANQRELTTIARDMMSSGPTAGTATSLTYAAVLYLIITLPLTQLVAALERRQQKAR